MGRFRTGLMVGLAAGYVAGTAAGREKFEQMKSAVERAWDSVEHKTISLEGELKMPAQEPFTASQQMPG